MRNTQSQSGGYLQTEGLGTKKSLFVMVTVVGCIAILYPKVFHPMMFGGTTPKQTNLKDHRSGTGLRQERPPHLRPESLHPAMRERGRAIPTTQTMPIVDRPKARDPPPRIVEGRPGPIPGMRPPMGAGSVHQAQPKGSSMGFIMPLYTLGIVAFFMYTLMKILFKKPTPNAPYGPVRPDPAFRKEVFGRDKPSGSKRHEECPKLVVTAIQGLIDAADEQLKLREKNSSTGVSKDTTENLSSSSSSGHSQNGNISNGHANNLISGKSEIHNIKRHSDDLIKNEQRNSGHSSERKRRDGSAERSVTSTDDYEDRPEPQSIYLEGALPHESQILVADSEIRTEEVIDNELNGTPDEPAVVLSSKMTLSLINLNSEESNDDREAVDEDIESPIADDIEIINGEEKDHKE